MTDILTRVASAPSTIAVFDVISHTSSDDRLLRVGGELVDGRRPHVIETFAAIANVLRGRPVRAFRFLGCGTAMRQEGKRTLRALGRILDPIEVFGTADMLTSHAFGPSGLRPDAERWLISAKDL